MDNGPYIIVGAFIILIGLVCASAVLAAEWRDSRKSDTPVVSPTDWKPFQTLRSAEEHDQLLGIYFRERTARRAVEKDLETKRSSPSSS